MQSKVSSLIVILAASISAAQAECPRWEKINQSGQKAMDAGDYKRAELTWVRAVKEAKNCPEKDPALPTSLKRLGECYLKNGKYDLADTTLKQAADEYKNIGTSDAEVVADLDEVGKNYRSIDFVNDVKPVVADLFKQAGVTTIGIIKLAQDQGNRIMMNLNSKFIKKIENPDVDQVGMDKVVSFDIVQEPDGALTISNIKGLRVRAKFWVTIVQSHVKPNDAEPSADVTATKMGISKTVSCKLPSDVIDPINTFVAKIKDFAKGTPVDAATLHTTNTTSTSTTSTAPGASSADVSVSTTTSTKPARDTSTSTSTTSVTTDSKPVASELDSMQDAGSVTTKSQTTSTDTAKANGSEVLVKP